MNKNTAGKKQHDKKKKAGEKTAKKIKAGIKARHIPKVSTGIFGLDEVLLGGFPEKRTTLMKGSAGTGKTVLGLEFLYHSAINDEPVIFVCFEETK